MSLEFGTLEYNCRTAYFLIGLIKEAFIGKKLRGQIRKKSRVQFRLYKHRYDKDLHKMALTRVCGTSNVQVM